MTIQSTEARQETRTLENEEPPEPETRDLLIFNVHRDATITDVAKLFGGFEVVEIRMRRNKFGQIHTYISVSADEAEDALLLCRSSGLAWQEIICPVRRMTGEPLLCEKTGEAL